MAISRPRPDILVKSTEGDPIAVIEVENLKDLTRGEAIELRHYLIKDGLPSQVPYFLLVSQDVGYLWKGTQNEDLDAPPMYEFSMDEVVARYSNRTKGARLYGAELEVLLLQWLTNLAAKPPFNTEEPERTLAISGFIESISGAVVLIEEEL